MLSTEYHFPKGTIFPTPSISLLCKAAELGGRTVSAPTSKPGPSQSYPESSQSSTLQAEACQADICSYDKHSATDKKNSYNNSV